MGTQMKYIVSDHHNFWQRGLGNSDIQEADVVFSWTDWPFADQMRALQSFGKKVIVWEHGFGALSDYSNNNKPMIADGYLAIGKESAKCVEGQPCLVVGNPIYDNLKKKTQQTGRALFVALHWVSGVADNNLRGADVTGYNQDTYSKLKEAYDFEWDVKISDKALMTEEGDNVWYSGVEGVRSLPRIKNRLPKYDAIFTPKSGTLDSFAKLMGVPVYITDEQESWRAKGDPKCFKIKGDNYIKIGDKLEPKKVDMTDYIKTPSVDMDVILDWVKTL